MENALNWIFRSFGFLLPILTVGISLGLLASHLDRLYGPIAGGAVVATSAALLVFVVFAPAMRR
jgi:hypothetical protein